MVIERIFRSPPKELCGWLSVNDRIAYLETTDRHQSTLYSMGRTDQCLRVDRVSLTAGTRRTKAYPSKTPSYRRIAIQTFHSHGFLHLLSNRTKQKRRCTISTSNEYDTFGITRRLLDNCQQFGPFKPCRLVHRSQHSFLCSKFK